MGDDREKPDVNADEGTKDSGRREDVHRQDKRPGPVGPATSALDEALGAEALLLGRRSYEWFAGRWPSRSGELADRLNSLPKYVVSSTLEAPAWNNSTVLKGDPVAEASKLKQELSGVILVPASFRLLRTLMEHDLIDGLRLKIFPVVLGAGERLFGETSDKKRLRLADSKTVGDGVAILVYDRG